MLIIGSLTERVLVFGSWFKFAGMARGGGAFWRGDQLRGKRYLLEKDKIPS